MRRLITNKTSILHPFLFSAFFVLALYAYNMAELSPSYQAVGLTLEVVR